MLLNTVPHPKPRHRIRVEDSTTDPIWSSVPAGQVTKVVDNKLSKTILYEYDAAGSRTSLDGPEASDTQAWSFDEVGRMTKITENSSDRAEWLYNLSGQQTKLTYGSGSYANRLYDAAGRLTSLAHKKSGGTVIQSFDYVLDKVGNRTKLTLNGGDYLEYLYDPLYQLTKETRKDSSHTQLYKNEFHYDYISNRTKLIEGAATTTYSYNTADQLTKSTTGGTDTTYTYDANGALTRKSSGGNNDDYLYDARSLLTKYDAPGSSSDTTYVWDLMDRRVKKDLNGTVTRFLYDHSIGEIIAEYDGSGTPALQASYIPTDLDSNVSITRSSTDYYFHPDALQSTWNLTQASNESIQNTYAYQAFGNQYGTPTANVSNTRHFTGAEWNLEDTSQTHRVNRYFPSLGRWGDRGFEGHNLYALLGNNPTDSAMVLTTNSRRGGIGGTPRSVCCTFENAGEVWSETVEGCGPGQTSWYCCYEHGNKWYRHWTVRDFADRPCNSQPNVCPNPPRDWWECMADCIDNGTWTNIVTGSGHCGNAYGNFCYGRYPRSPFGGKRFKGDPTTWQHKCFMRTRCI